MPLCHSEDHAVPVLPGGRAHSRRRARLHGRVRLPDRGRVRGPARSRRKRRSGAPRRAQGGRPRARPVEPVPARTCRSTRPAPSSRTSTTPRCRRSSARCGSRPSCSTAPHRTPATWRSSTPFATDEQRERWLAPLLEGEIRSAFAMTEPDVASSDATNIEHEMDRDGDDYVLNGRKWFISGAGATAARSHRDGQDRPDAPRHLQQSMILVPADTPGVTIARTLPCSGTTTARPLRDRVRRRAGAAGNLIGEEGGGFAIAQARLGPGRIHHCMRSIGVAERALELMCRRASGPGGVRVAPGHAGSDAGLDRRSRIGRGAWPRLLALKTAWPTDTVGNRPPGIEIPAIKVAAPNIAVRVIDRAIQAHGAAGRHEGSRWPAMYAQRANAAPRRWSQRGTQDDDRPPGDPPSEPGSFGW